MAKAETRPTPSRLTRPIGGLFTVFHLFMALYVVLLWVVVRDSGFVNLKVFAATVVVGLAVGISYLARQAHPAVRAVPSVLWVVVVGVRSLVSPPTAGTWDARSVVMAACLVLMVAALVYHVCLDVKALLAGAAAQSSEPPQR